MAEQLSNGIPAENPDVVMTEEGAPQSELETAQPPPTSISDASNPAPPAATTPASATAPEHLSTLQPVSASTPPASGGAPTRTGSMPPQPSARPEKPVAHGGPTRQFLNHNITPHLLEGMKHLAVNEPEKPLLWLSEFLKEKSKEIEG